MDKQTPEGVSKAMEFAAEFGFALQPQTSKNKYRFVDISLGENWFELEVMDPPQGRMINTKASSPKVMQALEKYAAQTQPTGGSIGISMETSATLREKTGAEGSVTGEELKDLPLTKPQSQPQLKPAEGKNWQHTELEVASKDTLAEGGKMLKSMKAEKAEPKKRESKSDPRGSKYLPQTPSPGSSLDAVKQTQAKQRSTYFVEGSEVPTAKTNIAALLEAGGSLSILKRTHTAEGFIEVIAQAELNGQTVQASHSVHKVDYLAKKAWEWAMKYIAMDPTILTNVDNNMLPIFKKETMVKLQVRDGKNSVLIPIPAPLAMFRELAREWDFAARNVETRAISRACDMILRQEFRSPEEINEELQEVLSIKEKS